MNTTHTTEDTMTTCNVGDRVVIEDYNSAGFRSEARRAGITEMELLGEDGEGDSRVRIWRLGDALVAETNGDPVWQRSDPQAFADLAEACGVDLATTIENDADCDMCEATATERTCERCGVTAMITDCGHQVQPRPIAPDGHHTYCDDCSDEIAEERAVVTYTINASDSETPPAWLRLCSTMRPGAQDSGRVLYTVTTEQPAALEAALEADDDVLEYERIDAGR